MVQYAPIGLHPLVAVIQSVRDIMAMDWIVRIMHTFREGNFCADFLAKLGVNQEEPMVVLESLQSVIRGLLLADRMRVMCNLELYGFSFSFYFFLFLSHLYPKKYKCYISKFTFLRIILQTLNKPQP